MPKSQHTKAAAMHILLPVLTIGMTLLTGITGSIPTASGLPWYATLQKPAFTPPGYLFGPVWTILYILMGIVFYRILSEKQTALRRELIVLFVLQLFANLMWSVIFFGLKNPFLAFLDIVILIFLITRLMLRLVRTDQVSAYMLTPYFIWVSFATVLNFSIWTLNR